MSSDPAWTICGKTVSDAHTCRIQDVPLTRPSRPNLRPLRMLLQTIEEGRVVEVLPHEGRVLNCFESGGLRDDVRGDLGEEFSYGLRFLGRYKSQVRQSCSSNDRGKGKY